HAASACLCSPEPATPQISTLSLHDALPISLDNVRVMTRTTVFGVYDGGIYGAIERVSDHLPMPPQFQPRQRLWRIVAKRCVVARSEEHTSELQSRENLVCRLLLEKKNKCAS